MRRKQEHHKQRRFADYVIVANVVAIIAPSQREQAFTAASSCSSARLANAIIPACSFLLLLCLFRLLLLLLAAAAFMTPFLLAQTSMTRRAGTCIRRSSCNKLLSFVPLRICGRTCFLNGRLQNGGVFIRGYYLNTPFMSSLRVAQLCSLVPRIESRFHWTNLQHFSSSMKSPAIFACAVALYVASSSAFVVVTPGRSFLRSATSSAPRCQRSSSCSSSSASGGSSRAAMLMTQDKPALDRG